MADADTGWSSATLTDATGCMPHGEASALVKLAVWSAVVPQRVRAIGHCLQQRSMRYTSDSSLVPARSLAQLKLVLAASKTLASAAARGRTAVGVSEDLSLAATKFVSFVVVV